MERHVNIEPDPDLDICMKVAATESQEDYVVLDYTLKYQTPWGQYQDMVMIIRFCGAFFHIKSEEEISKIEGSSLGDQISSEILSLLPNTKEFAEVSFLNEYGEGSKYKIEEVIGKGSYVVVREILLFVSATAIHRTIGKELGLQEKPE
nr:hypothetical protein [Tanacetum cinerariifolium]